MLELAVKARLPLISASTRDLITLEEVLEVVTGKTPVNKKQIFSASNQLYYFVDAPGLKTDYRELYSQMVAKESTCIVVNPLQSDNLVVDVGVIPVPDKILTKYLKVVVGKDEDLLTDLKMCLGGLTIKEVVEYIKLTTARDNKLTVDGVSKTRRGVFGGMQGLTQVDTVQTFYRPLEALKDWVESAKHYLNKDVPFHFIPRGIMLAGPAGVGKTEAAKYACSELHIPLFRLDIGQTKNKYVGNSEMFLRQALSTVVDNAPCGLLLDEIEKMFQSHGDSVTSSMLGQLLWWLAEHKSLIVTFMTTNRIDDLPPEVYRPGRVDEVLMVPALCESEALEFVTNLMGIYHPEYLDEDLEAVLDSMFNTSVPLDAVSHAYVKAATIKYIKNKNKN